MSKMHFYKYQGTGNDFIILDNRNWSYTALTEAKVKALCDRRFGIGADYLLNRQTKLSADYSFARATVTPNPQDDTQTVSLGLTFQK